MAIGGIEPNFGALYKLLMKTNFMASKAPIFGQSPSKATIEALDAWASSRPTN